MADDRKQYRSSRRGVAHDGSACWSFADVEAKELIFGGRPQLKIASRLLTNNNHMVMVLCVKPANANHVFRALADPTRRAIFEELTRQGEQTVHALTRYAGVSQPAVSKHLTVLKRAKLVRHRREGRETHYRAQADALAPMVDWLNLYGAFWRDRFGRLEALLERMDG